MSDGTTIVCCRVDGETKALLERVAERRGTTMSNVVRDAIEVAAALNGVGRGDVGVREPVDEESDLAADRILGRVPPEVRERFEEAIGRAGVSKAEGIRHAMELYSPARRGPRQRRDLVAALAAYPSALSRLPMQEARGPT